MTVVSLQSKTRPIEAERPPMRLVASDAPNSLSGLDDNARFRSIVMPHIDEAYRLAHWLTGNRTDAEDVVQDASMRAFRAIRSYAGGSARSWVLALCGSPILLPVASPFLWPWRFRSLSPSLAAPLLLSLSCSALSSLSPPSPLPLPPLPSPPLPRCAMTVVSLQSKTRPIEAERPPMRLVASDAPELVERAR